MEVATAGTRHASGGPPKEMQSSEPAAGLRGAGRPHPGRRRDHRSDPREDAVLRGDPRHGLPRRRRPQEPRHRQGRHRRDHAQQPLGVHPDRPRRGVPRRRPVLDLSDLLARADPVRLRGRRGDGDDHRVRLPRRLQQGQGGPPRARARHRDRRRGGHPHARRPRSHRSRLQRPRVRRGHRPRRPPDADLHVRHHRAAQGRPAHAAQPDDARRRPRRHDRVPGPRIQGHLVAPRGAHRRTRRELLPADDEGRLGNDLRRPAQGRRSAASGQPDLLLRGARASGRRSRPASRQSSTPSPARTARRPAPACRPRSRRSGSSRRERKSPRSSPPEWPRPTRRCSSTCARRLAWTRRYP